MPPAWSTWPPGSSPPTRAPTTTSAAAAALLAWLIEPADVGTFPDGGQLFQQHLHEHPVLAHVRATGDGRARRISDFLSDRQFRSLGLYRDFYRRRGVDYQVAIIGARPRRRADRGRAEPAAS